MTTESCIAELARAPVPANLVRVWIDDGQEGGWFENVTRARAAEIEEELDEFPQADREKQTVIQRLFDEEEEGATR